MRKEAIEVRFGRFFVCGGEDECWVWTGSRTKEGYGQFHLGNIGGKKRSTKATHVAIAMHLGIPIEDLKGKLVLHSCDNPPCVNPKHLRIGTAKDNADDRDNRGRRKAPAREAHGYAKLTEEAIVDIRANHTGKYGELTAFARKYGVTPTAILHVVNGRNWKAA